MYLLKANLDISKIQLQWEHDQRTKPMDVHLLLFSSGMQSFAAVWRLRRPL